MIRSFFLVVELSVIWGDMMLLWHHCITVWRHSKLSGIAYKLCRLRSKFHLLFWTSHNLNWSHTDLYKINMLIAFGLVPNKHRDISNCNVYMAVIIVLDVIQRIIPYNKNTIFHISWQWGVGPWTRWTNTIYAIPRPHRWVFLRTTAIKQVKVENGMLVGDPIV